MTNNGPNPNNGFNANGFNTNGFNTNGFNANSFNANASYETYDLKTVYAVFSCDKSPNAVIQAVSQANCYVALKPNALCCEDSRVVEFMVPADCDLEMLRTKLCRTCEDLTDLTADCCTFQVGVPAATFKHAFDALKKIALKVNRIDTIHNGDAYFTVICGPNVTTSDVATCLSDVQIDPGLVMPKNPIANNGNFANSNFANGNFANGNFANGNFANGNFANGNFANGNFANGATTPYGMRYNTTPYGMTYNTTPYNTTPYNTTPYRANQTSEYVMTQVIPALCNDLTHNGPMATTVAQYGITPQTCCNALLNTANNWWAEQTQQPMSSNWNNTMATWFIGQCANPNSAIANCCRTMGIDPAMLASCCAPYCVAPMHNNSMHNNSFTNSVSNSLTPVPTNVTANVPTNTPAHVFSNVMATAPVGAARA